MCNTCVTRCNTTYIILYLKRECRPPTNFSLFSKYVGRIFHSFFSLCHVSFTLYVSFPSLHSFPFHIHIAENKNEKRGSGRKRRPLTCSVSCNVVCVDYFLRLTNKKNFRRQHLRWFSLFNCSLYEEIRLQMI
ncbi:hypothetical protein HanPI659440_Chr13g0491081 [Helianthus annuus]|nr:hypothetical protein HanPI659440_Chr13g0491081 [Helianthus annuus]